ncbi:ATP-binding protein [Noviherbaspirillum sp. ST9]|uniref:ATP-binding response regulator n=1 Tax=Noviherbaspirillum sp. ST9 TaxID=3401606 RepID=UPI003B589621
MIRILPCALVCVLLICVSLNVHAAEDELRDLIRIADYGPDVAAKDAKSAADQANKNGDLEGELRALRILVIAHSHVDRGISNQISNRIIAIYREHGALQAMCELLSKRAKDLSMFQFKDANLMYREAIVFAQRHQLSSCLPMIYLDMGKGYVSRDEKSEAMAILEKAYALFQEQQDNAGMSQALGQIAEVFGGPEANEEDQEKAESYFRQALELIDPAVYRHTASLHHVGLGLSFFHRRKYDEARHYLERAMASSYEMGAGNYKVIIKFHLARVAKEDKRFEEALTLLRQSLPGLAQIADRYYLVGGFLTRAEALAELGRTDEILESLLDAKVALPRNGYYNSAKIYADYYARAARLYARLGDYQKAYQEMESQLESSQRLVETANTKLADELKTRFDVRLKEAENARLRAEQQQTDTVRITLALAFAFSLLLLGSVVMHLRRRAEAAKIDATHHLALANAEAQRAKASEAASQAKSAFLANMSHELRSPLNSILGFTRLILRDKRLAAELADDLRVVHKSGEHLYSLINQVLDLSKIEAGRATLVERNFDLHGLLDELEDMFAAAAWQKGLDLNVEYDAGIPQFIRADEVKLRQVLINLLSNALKFTSNGGVVLKVRMEACSDREPVQTQDAGEAEPSCSLNFSVADTGIGISPEELSRLGEAFVQAKAGQLAKEGTGLGLALSRSFVQLMGGALTISSEPERGCTVAFLIPVRPVARDDIDANATPPGRRVTGLAPGQPQYRILAVDDREDGRLLLFKQLTPLGFEVRGACNGEEAIAIWEEWQPHLIWMDMRMPVMDGREATRRIKATEQGQKTIVIALTASSFEEEREQILAIGCDDFVRKPFRENALFELMEEHLKVRFEYAQDAVPIPATRLDAASLARLPAQLRTELAQALLKLDAGAINTIIETIRSGIDTDLAQALDAAADQFDYKSILKVLSEIDDEGPRPQSPAQE